MNYIDGVVLAVPKENKAAYIKHAKMTAEIFKDYGALSIVECWGDDIPDGVSTSFPIAVKCKSNEAVCFSWISWPSREVRNEAIKKIKKDPRMELGDGEIPFDGKRMIFGGFDVVLNL